MFVFSSAQNTHLSAALASWLRLSKLLGVLCVYVFLNIFCICLQFVSYTFVCRRYTWHMFSIRPYIFAWYIILCVTSELLLSLRWLHYLFVGIQVLNRLAYPTIAQASNVKCAPALVFLLGMCAFFKPMDRASTLYTSIYS